MHITEIIKEIREFSKQEGVTPYRLFDLAGIKHKSAAGIMNSDDWNPTAATLAKLQDAIRAYRISVE